MSINYDLPIEQIISTTPDATTIMTKEEELKAINETNGNPLTKKEEEQEQDILEFAADLISSIPSYIPPSIESLSRRLSLTSLIFNDSPTESSIPELPHGRPPSDTEPKGYVAEEDKTFAMKLSDNANWEALKETFVDATQGIQVLAKDIETLAEETLSNLPFVDHIKDGFQAVALQGLELNKNNNRRSEDESEEGEGEREIGNVSVPVAPHGKPPSDEDSRGWVAEEDKSFAMKAEENWEQLKTVSQQTWFDAKQGLIGVAEFITGQKIAGEV